MIALDKHGAISYYKSMKTPISQSQTRAMKLEGNAAIEYAEAHDMTLSKYNDPTEDAREGLTPDEARAVAREDSRLIYLTLERNIQADTIPR